MDKTIYKPKEQKKNIFFIWWDEQEYDDDEQRTPWADGKNERRASRMKTMKWKEKSNF